MDYKKKYIKYKKKYLEIKYTLHVGGSDDTPEIKELFTRIESLNTQYNASNEKEKESIIAKQFDIYKQILAIRRANKERKDTNGAIAKSESKDEGKHAGKSESKDEGKHPIPALSIVTGITPHSPHSPHSSLSSSPLTPRRPSTPAPSFTGASSRRRFFSSPPKGSPKGSPKGPSEDG